MTIHRFVPRYSAWEQRTRKSFASQGAMALIGAEILELAAGRCVLAASFRPDLGQQHEFFHAGITSTLADSAGGYAAYSLFPENTEVLTVEFKINFVAPAHGERLIATAHVDRSGRTLTVCRTEVSVVHGTRQTVCALMQQTVMCVDRKV